MHDSELSDAPSQAHDSAVRISKPLLQPGDFWVTDRILSQPRLGRIVVEGIEKPLEKKPMQLLEYLAGRCGCVATREEILAELWPGVSVTGHSLNRLVSALRKALDDNATNPKLLITIRGVGYRLQNATTQGTEARDSLTETAPAFVDLGSAGPTEERRCETAEPGAEHVPVGCRRFLHPIALLLWVATSLVWGVFSALTSSDRTTEKAEFSANRPLGALGSALARYVLAQVQLAEMPAVSPASIEVDQILKTITELVRVGRPREAEDLLQALKSWSEVGDPKGLEQNTQRRRQVSAYHRLWAEILQFEGYTSKALEHSGDAMKWVHPPRDALEERSLILAAGVHGESLADSGDTAGITLIEEHLERAKDVAGVESDLVTRTMCSLGASFFYQRQLLEAEAFIEQCGARTARIIGVDSLEFATYEAFSGAVQWARGDREAALVKTQSALDRHRNQLGGLESRLTIDLLASLGTLFWMDGEFIAAEGRLREALALSDQILGASSRQTSVILQSLGVALKRSGRLEEAESVQRQNVAIRGQPGRSEVDLATAHHGLAAILR